MLRIKLRRDYIMADKAVLSEMYFADIVVENDWGYHLESLWYGSDAKNLALMIMDCMESWYLPNKDKMDPKIVEFYEGLEKKTKDDEESDFGITFEELTGEKFRGNGLRLEVISTNNLVDMFDFIAGQAFEIYAEKGEKLEDFTGVLALVNYLMETYTLDDIFVRALTDPNESTISEALYAIDLKYGYTQRTFRQQRMPQK